MTARATEACSPFCGSERSGVTRSDWSGFPNGVYFPSQSDGTCP